MGFNSGFKGLITYLPMYVPVVMRSKSWAWGRPIVGIAVWKPAEGMDFLLLCLLCAV